MAAKTDGERIIQVKPNAPNLKAVNTTADAEVKLFCNWRKRKHRAEARKTVIIGT